MELMLEGMETLLEKKKANGKMFGSNLIWSEIFISEWTLSLRLLLLVLLLLILLLFCYCCCCYVPDCCYWSHHILLRPINGNLRLLKAVDFVFDVADVAVVNVVVVALHFVTGRISFSCGQ